MQMLPGQHEDHRGTLNVPNEADTNPIKRNCDKEYTKNITKFQNKAEAKV